MDTWVELIPITDEPDLSGHAVSKYGAGYESDVGEIPPKDHVDIDNYRRQGTGYHPPIWPFTDDDNRDIAAGHKYVVLYAKASYDDIFHVRHWTQFCTWRSNAPTTPARICSDYNQSDYSDEP